MIHSSVGILSERLFSFILLKFTKHDEPRKWYFDHLHEFENREWFCLKFVFLNQKIEKKILTFLNNSRLHEAFSIDPRITTGRCVFWMIIGITFCISFGSKNQSNSKMASFTSSKHFVNICPNSQIANIRLRVQYTRNNGPINSSGLKFWS